MQQHGIRWHVSMQYDRQQIFCHRNNDAGDGKYRGVRLKNKIFQSRDLCLRALDTNSACAKSVRRNEWKERKNVRGRL